MLQFFRSLFSKPTSAKTDLSYGLLAQLEIEPLLAGDKWEKLEETAVALIPDDLTRLLDGLCLSHHYAPAIQRYLTAGSSELRQLLSGVHDTFLAWEARGGLIATETAQGQFDGFVHYLTKAYEQLNQSFDNPLFQAEAAARLVRVGMGLGELELAKEAFDLCTELVPTHLMGHFNYMRVVSPWWHGSLDELISYGDSIADPALHRLFQILCLHEIYSFLEHEKNSNAAATKLLKQDYRARIDKVLAGPAQADGTSLAAVYYNNYLAGLHHILGNAAARNQLIWTLGPHITPYPWHYFGLNDALAVQRLTKA